MTTIVADKTKLVADSRVSQEVSSGDTIFSAPKLFRKGNVVIGCAGHNDNIEAFIEWYGTRRKKPKFKIDEFEALVLTPHGLYFYDEDCSRDKVLDDWFAIGSGALAALGALHMGATLEQAVQIACKVDKHSGEPIQVLALQEPANGTSKETRVQTSTERGGELPHTPETPAERVL